MFSSSTHDHSFQEAVRNSCASETRPGLTILKSSVPLPGILDMTFNRRSLDWSELQVFSPHSTSSNNHHVNPPPTHSQPTGDLYSQLSHWNFPFQPPVPPRLVLWGPFNNQTGPHYSQIQQPAHSAQTYCGWASYPLTSPSPGCKAPKRGRDGYLPSACLSLASSAMPSKRHRAADQDAYTFPPTPRYTAYQISAYPTPLSSPNNQSPIFHNDQSIAEDSLSISPLSLSPQSFPEASPTDSKRFYFRDPSTLNFPYSQQSCSTPFACNYGYHPKSPISPKTSLSPSPLSTNFSPFPTTSDHGSHQLTLQNPLYPNIWSPEWHQTFNQFRYQKQTI